MIGDRPSRDAEWNDADGLDPHESRRRFVLGLVALAFVAGFVAVRLVGDGSLTTVGLLSTILGGALGGTLLGEHLSGRHRSLRVVLLPSIELLLTYAMLGVLLVAVASGRVTVGVLSGLLLLCSITAIMVTSARSFDPIGDADDVGPSGQADDGATCARCGETVDRDRAIPDRDGNPCHRDCWDDAHASPDWFDDGR